MTAALRVQNEQRAAVKSESGGEARTGKRCAALGGEGMAHLLLPRDALDRALEDLAALDLPLEADEQGRLEGQLPRPVLQAGRRTACVARPCSRCLLCPECSCSRACRLRRTLRS